MTHGFSFSTFVFQREKEIARRRALKEERQKKEREESLKESEQPDEDEEEQEEQDHLPPIYMPDPPSPLYCGFYSLPGQFWLSMVHTHRHRDIISVLSKNVLSPHSFSARD